MGTLLEAAVANNYALIECSSRHSALVELVDPANAALP